MKIGNQKEIKQYPKEITENAQLYGYKTANLDFLNKIISNFGATNDINIAIPQHIGISNDEILSFIIDKAPSFNKKWQDFRAIQGESKALKPEAINTLHEMQGLIHQAFDNNDFNWAAIQELSQGENWMVRSTGNEDRVDIANPGGNESVPSDADSLNKSIAIVVASYFGEKSMSQRLQSGEEITKALPLMPCLIQKLVGESSSNNIPVSGVIYTDNQHVRIQAAPGHGELVVNSKGAVDNIFITKENIVYQYLGDKSMRLKPVIDYEKGKISLEEAENGDLAKVASLSEEVSVNLAMLAHEIADAYGMRMDIEFVFDPGTNTINIVQARPIPEGQRAGLTPSVLKDDFIISQKPEKIDGHIITPEVMSAKIITNDKEVLIREDIGDALHATLSGNANIKAVIVNKSAPDTSHEAGFFSSKAVPVIFVDNYELAKSWTQNLGNNNLVIDPQRGAIYQVDKSLSENDLIAEGIFISTLPPLVTANEKSIVEGPSRESPEIESKLIGDILREAANNSDATQKLFSFVEEEMKITGTGEVIDQKTLADSINILRNLPDSQEAYAEHKEKLGNILNFITAIRNEQNINPATYQQSFINGVELYQALKLLEKNHQDARLHYLNLHKKFEGIVTSKSQDRFSSSIAREMNLHEEKQSVIEDAKRLNIDLTIVNQNAFLELALNKKYIIRDDSREKWLSFCYEACKDEARAEQLKNLVRNIDDLSVRDTWININFVNAYNEDSINALINLQTEYNENSESIQKTQLKLYIVVKIYNSTCHCIN